jgi:Fe-S-cluster containining protein
VGRSKDANAFAWLRAAGDAEVCAAIGAVYRDVAEQIEARGPSCWASGRCCNFEAAGHRLYVTGLEAAYTLSRLERSLTAGELESAVDRGGCPFQVKNLCGVHAIKPLGCRVYFCDRSAQSWQHALSEHALAQIREIHERLAVPYEYGEWRGLLGRLIETARAD